MNRLFISLALVAMVANPALAQTKDRPAHQAPTQASQTYAAQDQQQRRSANRRNDVYDIRGQYVGTDPDSTVRSQLANDPSQAD